MLEIIIKFGIAVDLKLVTNLCDCFEIQEITTQAYHMIDEIYVIDLK